MPKSLNRPYFYIALLLWLAWAALQGVWIFHDIVYTPFDLVWLSYGVGQMLIVFGASVFVQIAPLKNTRL